MFQPITSAAPQEAANTHKTNRQQSAETSLESSLPCGQWTPIASASVTSTPCQHTPPQPVVPPQPAIPQFPNPNNIHLHTQQQNTPQVSPITQPRPQSPLRTNTNPPTQPFIPAAETHKSVSSSPQQHIPKSVNGEGVKSSKQQNKSSAPDGQLCYRCKQPGHLKIVQSNHTVPSTGQEDTYQQNVLLNSRAMSQLMTDANFEREKGTKTAKCAGKNGREHRISHNHITATLSTKSVYCWRNHTNTHGEQPTISTRSTTAASSTNTTGQPANYQVRPV